MILFSETTYGKIFFFEKDDPIGLSLHTYGEWAGNEIQFLLTLINEGDTIIDVGANIGSHTLAFAKQCGSKGKVFAFEPQPEIFELLNKTVTTNDLHNVVLFPEGVGSIKETLFMEINDYSKRDNWGAKKIFKNNNFDCKPVIINTIDSLNLKELKLIKIDAEGMGQQVVEGMQQTIKTCSPIIFCECNEPKEAFDLALSMKDYANYSIYVVRVRAFNVDNFNKNKTNIFKNAWECNLLFLPSRINKLDLKINDKINIIPINDMNILFEEVYKTPQYDDENTWSRDIKLMNKMIIDLKKKNDTKLYEENQCLKEKIKGLNFRLDKLYYEINGHNSKFKPNNSKVKPNNFGSFIKKNTRTLQRLFEKNTRTLRCFFKK